MNNFNDDTEIIKDIQEILLRRSTGGEFKQADESDYQRMRKYFLTNNSTKNYVPGFVVRNRELGAFWNFIKSKFSTYKERRVFIYEEFTQLFDVVEGINVSDTEIRLAENNHVIKNKTSTSDNIVIDNKKKFDHKSEIKKTIYWIFGSIIIFLIIYLIYCFTGTDISMQK